MLRTRGATFPTRRWETEARTVKAKPKKEVILTVRGDRRWKLWLNNAAIFMRTDVAKMTDRALKEYVAKHGYDDPAPPR